MFAGMLFRKDCKDCGRSFFTPDRKTNLCPRCAERIQKRDQVAPKVSIEARSSLTPTDDPKIQISSEYQTHQDENDLPGGEVPEERAKKLKVKKVLVPETPGMAKAEIVLTKEQEQEIMKRYQAYVEGMERPPKGRRKSIAADMGLPYHAVILAVRKWNQGQAKAEDLTRDERFLVETSYFRRLAREGSLSRIKEQITQETGLSYWQVCRYLDLLHDGEDRLREVADVSPEQRIAILAEYHAYLSAPGPPGPPLHALIAERTEVSPKQVHKVLLAYRLARLREKMWT
jgi:hypothetical protein